MKTRLLLLLLGFASALNLVSCKPRKDAEKTPAPQATGAFQAVKDPVQKEIYAYRGRTRQDYNARNFDALEREVAELRAAKPRFDEGSWKIAHFYDAFDCRKDEPETMWKLHDEIHRAWIAAKPRSSAARIAHAGFLTDYAWHARGSGYADTVSPEGWQLFRERLAAAQEILDKARGLPEKDPIWWQKALRVALGESWPAAKYDQLTEEATAFEPAFWGYDCSRAYSLTPRWLGKPGDWEDYAVRAAARPGGLGAEVYARIVSSLRGQYNNVFEEANVSWPKTREGLEILLAKYPQSLEVLNESARLAWLGNDREFAAALAAKMGDGYLASVWGNVGRFTAFKRWVEQGGLSR